MPERERYSYVEYQERKSLTERLPVVRSTAAARAAGAMNTACSCGRRDGWGADGALCPDHKKTIFSPNILCGAAVRYSRQIKPISYLKANAAEVLQELERQRKPLIITQNGEAKAVIQDVVSYEETQEALALLKILALGGQQVGRGEVTPVGEVVKRLRSKAPPA